MRDMPENPAPAEYTPALIDKGSTLIPPLGGAEQRINRIGSKFRVTFTMPIMENKGQGKRFINRLIRGKSEGVRMLFPLGGVDVGNVGSPTIAGANQIGRLISMKGFNSGYVLEEGNPLSITDAEGRHYLHFVDQDVIADAQGNAQVIINPALRVIFPDNSQIHFDAPKIEGLVEGDSSLCNKFSSERK